MSRPQEPRKPFLLFGNPFQMMLPKGSHMSTTLRSQLNTFEETLAERIEKLKRAGGDDFLRLSWMGCAMEVLNGIHTDLQSLITVLELPVCIWKDKWMDVYFDNSMKFLDIYAAFDFQISRLKQGNFLLQCGLSNLDVEAHESLAVWSQYIASENPRLEEWFSVMDDVAKKLDLPKIKNNAKAEVLMRAMYGVNVVTLLVFSIFAAVFSGSAKRLMDLEVSGTFLWAGAFADLQAFVNAEIRSIYWSGRVTLILKELKAIDTGVKKLYPVLQDGVDPVEAKVFQDLTSDFEELSQGLELLDKEVHKFSKIVLAGRDDLLSKIMNGGKVSDP